MTFRVVEPVAPASMDWILVALVALLLTVGASMVWLWRHPQGAPKTVGAVSSAFRYSNELSKRD